MCSSRIICSYKTFKTSNEASQETHLKNNLFWRDMRPLLMHICIFKGWLPLKGRIYVCWIVCIPLKYLMVLKCLMVFTVEICQQEIAWVWTDRIFRLFLPLIFSILIQFFVTLYTPHMYTTFIGMRRRISWPECISHIISALIHCCQLQRAQRQLRWPVLWRLPSDSVQMFLTTGNVL